MSHTDSNRLVTPTVVMSNSLGADSARVFSKTTSEMHLGQDEAQAATQTAAVCSKFLVNLSHEMRTRLSSIVGITEMMLESGLSDAQKEFIETVAESAQALAVMTDDIADFSRGLALGAAVDAHKSELGGIGSREGDLNSNGNGAGKIAPLADASTRGATMPAKTLGGGNRSGAFKVGANFSTRVPPDTAKLIRILVAEDHLMNQRVMLRMLSRLGFSADAVCNGAEAVAAITRSPYDIVLMDCQMPELDGYEATRRIRSSGGRFRSTPIIAVTANAMAGDREKCLASGMSDYMSKPVMAQTLATTLEKWILPDASGATTAPPAAFVAGSSDGSSSDLTRSGGATQSGAGSATASEPFEVSDAVDPVAIETLRSMDTGDEGFVNKIIELFLVDTDERIAAMKVAAEKGDGAELKRVAHALKGSCGHFGAARLAALCRKMEQIGTRQPVENAIGTYLELEAEAGRVRVALEAAKEISPTTP